MRFIIRALLKIFFKIRIYGNNLDLKKASLIMPNHISFWDAVFLYAYLPKGVYFVVNTGIAKKIGIILRMVNHITIDPLNPYALKKVVSVIREGRTVVIFPEGRITYTGNLMKVYNGIGFIALKTGVGIHPVIFRGLERSKLSRIKDKIKSRWFPDVSIYIGGAVKLEPCRDIAFKLQKKDISNKILILLQQTMFLARQKEEKCHNLFDKFLEAGRLYGDGQTIAEDIGGSISYRQAAIGAYALAGRLKQLLADEQRAGVMLPNSIGHLVTLFSLFYLGKTAAILNFSTGASNNLNCAETAGLKTILTSRLFVARGNLGELIDNLSKNFRVVYLEDLKKQVGFIDKIKGLFKYLSQEKSKGGSDLILFTSGSEDNPKGVVLSHDNILANLNQIASIIDYTPRDKMMNALPMFHSFGLTAGTLLPVFNGIKVFLYPSPLHYKIIPEVAYDRNITVLLGTPTFLYGYAKYAGEYDFYSVRYVLAGGEKLNDEVRRLWQEKFGLRIFEGYGTTETSPVLSINTPLFHRTGTVGRILPGIDWRLEQVPGVEDGGCLLVKGPNIMKGYLFHDKGFVSAPLWYDCGDVVSIDKDGFIRINSRLKRFAKVSGEMVSLDAVEKSAENCFGTDRNGAVNLPDTKKGEKIVLYTMYRGASKQILREFLSRNKESMLAMPAEVVVVDKLPLLGSGKIDYVALKSLAANRQETNE